MFESVSYLLGCDFIKLSFKASKKAKAKILEVVLKEQAGNTI